jgi:hypothetical protein
MKRLILIGLLVAGPAMAASGVDNIRTPSGWYECPHFDHNAIVTDDAGQPYAINLDGHGSSNVVACKRLK